MKAITCFALALFALLSPVRAQDVLYLNDQSRVVGMLTDLTRERVSVQVNKGSSAVKFTFGADRVLAVVNRRGRFVCLDQLWFMPSDQRTRLIEQFVAGKEGLTHDMLIRDNPVQVLWGRITAASGSGVTYLTLNGSPATIPKADLIGVFYKSGKHELLTRASVLCDKVDQMGGKFPPPGTPPVPPRPKATPVVSTSRPGRNKPARPDAARPNAARPRSEPAVEAATEPAPTAQAELETPIATPMAAVTPEDTTAIGPIATTGIESGTSSNAMLSLSDTEYEEYRLQALERVEDFGTMLGVVADKTVESGQKDKAISEILKMFKPDATIQVSSTTPGRAPATLRMKDYLIRLKLLPYTSVNIEWTDVQFVQELTQRDDGNYYGKIRGEQRFSGLNQKTGFQYSDITEKDVDVMLTPYKKQTEGQNQRKWAVLLGNVGVVTTN